MTKHAELLLVAALSLAAGLWIGSRVSGRASEALAGSISVLPDAAPSTDRAESTELREPEQLSISARPAESQRSSRAPAEAVSARKPSSASPIAHVGGEGSGSVTGAIVTLDGLPLAGAELELEPPKDAPKLPVRRTTSGADGRFAFDGLPDGVWAVTATHAAHVLQRKTTYPTRVSTGATVDFLACPATSVEVRVAGPEAERARVAYRRAHRGEPQWSSWSPSSPRIALTPGAWEVCAFVDPLEDWPTGGWKLAPLASVVETVQVGAGEAASVTLELEAVDGLYGTVTLPEGHQSAWSRPRVMLIEPKDGTRADFESEGDRISLYAHVDEQGRYALFRLPYERWTVGVALGWGSAPTIVEVIEVDGLTRVDFDRFEPEGEDSIVVDAYSPDGQRMTEGVSLSLVWRDEDDEPDDYVYRPSRTVLEADGGLRVIALPMNEELTERTEKKEELLLRAWAAGFAMVEQPLTGLNGERFRIAFTVSAELEVVLVGEGGARATRKCEGWLEGEHGDHWSSFDEGARARVFRDLHPGTYTLTLLLDTYYGSDWRQIRLHRSEVEVGAGKRMLEIPMPVRADLVVRCPGIKKDVEAVLRGMPEDRTEDDEDEYWGTTWVTEKVDEHGQVRFENMLAGTYRLTIGARMQLVRVPGPTVEFEGCLPDRFMFRLEKGDSPLRAAGVRSGDVLLTVGGEALGGAEAEKRLAAFSAQSEGTLELVVERSGGRVELELDAAALDEDESFATDLEPDLE